MEPRGKWLQQNLLLAQVSAGDRTELARCAIRRQYQKGEFIAHYQEVWPYLLLAEEGAIDLLRESEEGRSLIVATLQPAEIFWGLALFYADAPSVVTLQAPMQLVFGSGHFTGLCPFCWKMAKHRGNCAVCWFAVWNGQARFSADWHFNLSLAEWLGYSSTIPRTLTVTVSSAT